jgi:hypothetical protein
MKIRYIITGSVASIIYGEPRLTHDVDLVIELDLNEIQAFVSGFPDVEFYCPPSETIRDEIKKEQRGHFNLIHHETGFKADIYTCGYDKLHKWALKNRKSVEVENEVYWVAPIEYVILRKLEFYREGKSQKHLQDISGMLELSGKEIDYNFLSGKVAEMGLENEWETVANSQPNAPQ